MKTTLFAATALSLLAAPAQAQLLGGGGGLSGTINGTVGSTIGSAGDIGTTIRRTTDSVRSTTRGAVDGSASSDGNQSVDARSGSVRAERNANASLTGNVTQLATTPIAPIGGSASGSGSASAGGNGQAQLIGTDTVGAVAGQAVGTARGQASSATNTVAQAIPAVPAVPSVGSPVSGSASGEGEASGNASSSGDLMGNTLAVAGSAASAAQGSVGVAPGMPVMDPTGQAVGTVSEVTANGRGQVEQVVVEADGARQAIPADRFAASGNALVLASGEGSLSRGAEEPAPAEQSAPAE